MFKVNQAVKMWIIYTIRVLHLWEHVDQLSTPTILDFEGFTDCHSYIYLERKNVLVFYLLF